MLNHALFLRPPSLPWCWGRASPSSPCRASRLVHEHGQRRLPALAHCPGSTSARAARPCLPALPGRQLTLPQPQSRVLLPSPLPGARVLSNLPQEHLPNRLPAELHPASASLGPFLLTLPKTVPTQDTITGLLGPCQAQAGSPCTSAASLFQETPGWPHPTQAQLRGVHASRCSPGIFPQRVGWRGL